jgi:hypothetical protein
MNLRARIGRLWDRASAGASGGKSVEVIPEHGPAIEWETPTGLILRVSEDCTGDPASLLTEEQRALIEPGDIVGVFCPPRVRLPDSDPSRLVPHKLGSPRLELPRRDASS